MDQVKDKAGRAVLYLRYFNPTLKAMFKAYCVRRGVTMTKVVEDHMRECVKKDQGGK